MPFTQFGYDSRKLQYLAKYYISISLFGQSFRMCSESEIYAKALEIDTIQIHPGWNILDLMEVIQVAKKEAKVVGGPIDTQLLKYLFLRGVYATHNKYWEELNNWLNDKNLNELEMSTLYQELVLRKHEVELEQKFKGPTPTNNNLAMQLYAKVHSRSTLKSDIMMAIKGSNEANIAHVANYGDLCRHPLCRGKRNSAKHLWSECRRNPNNLQNKLRHNNDRSKFDRGIKNGIRTNSGGNNFPGSSNFRSNNIINSGFKQDRVGSKPNFRSNSNYRGSERRDGKSVNNSRGDSKYSNKFNQSTSRNNNFQQGFKEQNKTNIGGLERNVRGKYNSQVVKGAMFAIQKQLPNGKRKLSKDFQAALHVEDLAANFA